MTDKMRRIQSRLKKLSRLFPVKPVATPEKAISERALKRLSSEDLTVLRSMILSRQAGRPVREPTEQESRARDAYQSAFAEEARAAGYSLTGRSPRRRRSSL